MKKNYLWITASGPICDSSYFIDLKDKNQMVQDLNDFINSTARRCQKVVKVDYVEDLPGAW